MTKLTASNTTIVETSTLPESPQPTTFDTVPRLTDDPADLLFLIPDRFLSPEQKLELSQSNDLHQFREFYPASLKAFTCTLAKEGKCKLKAVCRVSLVQNFILIGVLTLFF